MPATADRFVYIVGGTGSVSDGVRTTLAANGFQVVRLAGRDRFETSVAVAQNLDRGYTGTNPPPRNTVVLADGISFPDALSAGPVATMYYGPVLLTNKTTVPTVVRNYVNGRAAIRTVHAIGGNAAQAVGVFGSRAGERIVGFDRFDTSAKVAQRFFAGAPTLGYANGLSFPDALTGGALMSAMWQPLVLVQAGTVPAAVGSQATLFRPSTDEVLTFGGTAVVSESVRAALSGYAGTQNAMQGPNVARVDNPLHPNTSTTTGGTPGSARPNALSPSQRLRPASTGSTFQDSLLR
jgi:putative cell wall-binding protein